MGSMAKPLGTVALATLASRILGLVRDLLMAAYFGAGRVADIFFIAFMIPNLFRRLVAEGSLSVSFIPVYTESLVRHGREKSLPLASDVLVIQTLAMTLVTAAGIILSPQIISVFSGEGMTPGLYGLALNLIRIMFPFLILVSLVSFSMGYLNSHGVFFAPAFAPVLLNIGMITGILCLGRLFNEPVYGAALGVLLGGILQVLLQLPYMVMHGFRLRVSFNFRHPDVVRVFRTMIPAVFGVAAYQINAVVSNLLAAMIGQGSVSYIYYTNRLTELVFGVFIVSIGNVVLPAMSRASVTDDGGGLRASADETGLRASGEADRLRASRGKEVTGLDAILTGSLSAAMFVAVPAAAGLIAAGLPIVSMIFMRGSFTYTDSLMTFSSLVWAAAGLVFMAAARVVTPAFYTLKDTKVPVISACVSIVVNFILGYFLMHTGLRHAGLTLAGCAASLIQSALLVFSVTRKHGIGVDRFFWSGVSRMILAALIMGAVVFFASGFTDWKNSPGFLRGAMLLSIITGGAAVYYICALMFRVDEARYLYRRLRAYLKLNA